MLIVVEVEETDPPLSKGIPSGKSPPKRGLLITVIL
jgi:hypothetical protein